MYSYCMGVHMQCYVPPEVLRDLTVTGTQRVKTEMFSR